MLPVQEEEETGERALPVEGEEIEPGSPSEQPLQTAVTGPPAANSKARDADVTET